MSKRSIRAMAVNALQKRQQKLEKDWRRMEKKEEAHHANYEKQNNAFLKQRGALADEYNEVKAELNSRGYA